MNDDSHKYSDAEEDEEDLRSVSKLVINGE